MRRIAGKKIKGRGEKKSKATQEYTPLQQEQVSFTVTTLTHLRSSTLNHSHPLTHEESFIDSLSGHSQTQSNAYPFTPPHERQAIPIHGCLKVRCQARLIDTLCSNLGLPLNAYPLSPGMLQTKSLNRISCVFHSHGILEPISLWVLYSLL